MCKIKNKSLGLTLGAVAAAGAIVSLAYLIHKKRPVNVVVLDDLSDGAGPDVLTHMPAEMFLSQFSLPTGLTLACEKCVVSDMGVTGVLTRCETSGIYQVFDGKVIASVDQDFAAGAAELYPAEPPKTDNGDNKPENEEE